MKKIWKNLIHPPKILLFIVYFITICLVILSILLLNIDFSDLKTGDEIIVNIRSSELKKLSDDKSEKNLKVEQIQLSTQR